MKEIAISLAAEHWRSVEWREGSNFTLRSRFARVRVRAAHRDDQRSELRPEEWALIEWPVGHKEPMKYWLSTLATDVPLERMVLEAKMRWRIERDYQDLKQDLGLGDYEGRGWRGFHHHARPPRSSRQRFFPRVDVKHKRLTALCIHERPATKQ